MVWDQNTGGKKSKFLRALFNAKTPKLEAVPVSSILQGTGERTFSVTLSIHSEISKYFPVVNPVSLFVIISGQHAFLALHLEGTVCKQMEQTKKKKQKMK